MYKSKDISNEMRKASMFTDLDFWGAAYDSIPSKNKQLTIYERLGLFAGVWNTFKPPVRALLSVIDDPILQFYIKG